MKIEIKLLEGKPSSTIVNTAEEFDVDLIVIGSRGIGGITGWILGSTSRNVVESCTKPILVVK
jgi:nucleotide-binding universal stress UspA family protein